jgi:hypothetical protein
MNGPALFFGEKDPSRSPAAGSSSCRLWLHTYIVGKKLQQTAWGKPIRENPLSQKV